MTTKNRIESLKLSKIGFGGAPLGNLYRAIADESATATVRSALTNGINYFDTAPHYGQGLSERRLGDVLRHCAPSSYRISTKVGRLLKPLADVDGSAIKVGDRSPARHGFVSPLPFDIYYDYSYDGIMRSYEASLQRLGLAHIDILLVHDIGVYTHGTANVGYFNDLAKGGYRALDELRANNDISAIGLGVNEWQVCVDAMDIGQWDCFLLAGRYSLLEQEAIQHFLPLCEQHGAKLILGGVYNSGILATGTRSGSQLNYNYEVAPQPIVDRVRKIETICDSFDVRLAAAALQFALALPLAVSVIAGTGNPRRIAQTMELMSANIPTEFWSSLVSAGLLDSAAILPSSSQ